MNKISGFAASQSSLAREFFNRLTKKKEPGLKICVPLPPLMTNVRMLGKVPFHFAIKTLLLLSGFSLILQLFGVFSLLTSDDVDQHQPSSQPLSPRFLEF